MQTIFLILVFLFGSAIGSFLNVVILRLPEGESLDGRSHCPSCGHILGFLDLFPIFSYVFLAGKCRHCGQKISPRYFFIELATALLFALSFWLIMPTAVFGILLLLKYWLVCSVLVVVFVIDLEHYLILDSVIFSGSALVVILNLALDLSLGHWVFSLHSNFILGLLGALGGSLPFFLIWYFSKGAWMGFGDVKLALFLGAALLWPEVFAGLMAGIMLGGLVSSLLLLFTKKTLKSRLPFGTFLSIGALIGLFYGSMLIHWYLAILGF